MQTKSPLIMFPKERWVPGNQRGSSVYWTQTAIFCTVGFICHSGRHLFGCLSHSPHFPSEKRSCKSNMLPWKLKKAKWPLCSSLCLLALPSTLTSLKQSEAAGLPEQWLTHVNFLAQTFQKVTAEEVSWWPSDTSQLPVQLWGVLAFPRWWRTDKVILFTTEPH